jgi:SPP1 family predicted phage head-tail adaptor
MAVPRPVYNKAVALQSPGGTQSATTGERTTTWTTVATVWADISPLSVRDMLAAGQMQSEVSHRVKVRYSSTIAAIDASWRVLYGSRVLVISGVRNLEEDSRVIELICGEGMREE